MNNKEREHYITPGYIRFALMGWDGMGRDRNGIGWDR